MNHLGDTNKMVSETPRTDAVSRINEYLCVGGFFNPEIVNVQQHEAVRDTLIQVRDELNAANRRISRLVLAGDCLLSHRNSTDYHEKVREWDKAKKDKP